MSEMISIVFKNSDFSAYFTSPDDDKKHPAIILIHEVWGLTEHIKDVANRFAKQGYIVLAPDLLSHTGITEKVDQNILKEVMNPETRDEAQKKLRAAMAPIQSPEFGKETIERLKECVNYLLDNHQGNGNIAVVGFCFGGTYSYSLAIHDDRLKAAVPFYGHAPQNLDEVKTISCPVLAFYGEKDQMLISQLPELKEKMKAYSKDFEATVYPDTGHAFFNDTNPTMYKKEAADDAWKKTVKFLETHMA
jgi:carboxymethylenebutenolidase